jgi:hypothetical protein
MSCVSLYRSEIGTCDGCGARFGWMFNGAGCAAVGLAGKVISDSAGLRATGESDCALDGGVSYCAALFRCSTLEASDA